MQRERARLGNLDVRQQIARLGPETAVAQEVELTDDAMQRQADLVREGLDEAGLRGGRLEQPMGRPRVEQILTDQPNVRRFGRAEQLVLRSTCNEDHQLCGVLPVDEGLRDDALLRESGFESCEVSAADLQTAHLTCPGRRRSTTMTRRPSGSPKPPRPPR